MDAESSAVAAADAKGNTIALHEHCSGELKRKELALKGSKFFLFTVGLIIIAVPIPNQVNIPF